MNIGKYLPYAGLVIVLLVGYFYIKGQRNALEQQIATQGDVKVEMIFNQPATETSPATRVVKMYDLDTLMNIVFANQEFLVNRMNKIDPPAQQPK